MAMLSFERKYRVEVGPDRRRSVRFLGRTVLCRLLRGHDVPFFALLGTILIFYGAAQQGTLEPLVDQHRTALT